MNKNLTITETAQELGVSVDTIRRWEKKGLIKASRSEQNYRLFNLDEVLRVHNKVAGNADGINHYKILKSKKKTSFAIKLNLNVIINLHFNQKTQNF